jgi:hypothetical protein
VTAVCGIQAQEKLPYPAMENMFFNKSDENIKLKIKDAGINNVGDLFIDDRDEDLKDDILINDIIKIELFYRIDYLNR